METQKKGEEEERRERIQNRIYLSGLGFSITTRGKETNGKYELCN